MKGIANFTHLSMNLSIIGYRALLSFNLQCLQNKGKIRRIKVDEGKREGI